MRILRISKLNTFLVGIMMVAILLCCSNQVQAAQSGDYTYTVTDGKAQITRYTGVGGVITIPSTLDGFPVTSISKYAFADCTSLKTISLPQGLTSIGDCAFFSCTGLKTINLSEELTSVGYAAFYDCKALTSINFPQGLQSIGRSAFYDCEALTSIDLPQGLTSIGKLAFSHCVGLTNIRFNSATTAIYNEAYTIPVTTKIIGYDPSTAKDYAEKYNRTFEVVGTTIDVTVTGLILKPISSREIDLSWDKVNGAKSYTIYRATSERGTYAKVGSAKKVSFKNTKLLPSTSYWYKVTAVTTTGESEFSDVKSATTPPLTPSGLKAKAVSSTEVTLTWKVVVGCKYNVYRSATQKGEYVKIADGLNDAVYADSNLTPKTTYRYEVTALDSNENESDVSKPVKGLTKAR